MKVRFEVTYQYVPNYTPKFKADVTMHLPVDPSNSKYIPTVLMDAETKVWDETLWADWGHLNKETGTRTRTRTFYAVSWDELKQIVETEMMAAVTKLREVRQKNEQMLASVPPNTMHEFEL